MTQHDPKKPLERLRILLMSPMSNPEGQGASLQVLPWLSPSLWICRLDQVMSAKLSRKLMTAATLGVYAWCVPRLHQANGCSSNNYSLMLNSVPGTRNVIQSETYAVPPFIEIPIERIRITTH